MESTQEPPSQLLFRSYRPDDLTACARLAREAFPYGRGEPGKKENEWTMEGYVEVSLLYSTWTDVACIGRDVVGFLFGRVEDEFKSRGRLSSIFTELKMTAEFLLSSPKKVISSFGLMWNVWITQFKLAEHRPHSDAEIELLIVDSKHRGMGIGKQLVDRFLDHARQAGAGTVTVYTEDLQSDFTFYEKYGFKKVATFHDDTTSYYANRDSTAIIYALDLRRPRESDKSR